MPSFHQIQEWQDEYYSGLNATIKKAQDNVVHDDPSIKDYPFAIVHREWMSVIGAAVGYIIRNKPIEYLKARYELASWTQSKTDHWLRFRLSVTELFDYLRSLSKYCCWSLIGKIQCPTYSEELLFNAIQNNDFEAYSEICRTEKLNLFDLSLAAGFLWSPSKSSDNDEELSNEEFGARFERNLIVAGTNIDSTNSFFSRLAGRLNEPYCNLDYPHREMVGMIVKGLIDIIVYYDFFELYEKEAINELLDNPEYDDLLAEAQLFYYSRYHELPSRMKVLIDLDSWEDEDGQETKPEVQPLEQEPGEGEPEAAFERVILDEDGLRRLSDNAFNDYSAINDKKAYFKESMIDTATALRMSVIYDLFKYLVSEGKLEKSQEVLDLIAFRLTGKDPFGIDKTRQLAWKGTKSDYSLCYFLWKMFAKEMEEGGSHKYDTQYWSKAEKFFIYADGKLVDAHDEQTNRQQFTNKTGQDVENKFAKELRRKLLDLQQKQAMLKSTSK